MAIRSGQQRLNDALAVCPVDDVLEGRPGGAGREDWGFSVADMFRLGLARQSIRVKVPTNRPIRGSRQNLAQISADECLALLK
jgi:hypothetical protein